MAQFDEMKKELGVFIDGVNSELLSLEGRLKSFTIDTRGVNASFDLLTAELLRVAILFEGVAQKIQSFADMDAKASEQFADSLGQASTNTEKALDTIDESLLGFDSVVIDTTGDMSNLDKSVNTTTSDFAQLDSGLVNTTADANKLGDAAEAAGKQTDDFGSKVSKSNTDLTGSADKLGNKFTSVADTFDSDSRKFASTFSTVRTTIESSADFISRYLKETAEAMSKAAEGGKGGGGGGGKSVAAGGGGEEKPYETSFFPIGDDLDDVSESAAGASDELEELRKRVAMLSTMLSTMMDQVKPEELKAETVNISQILKEYADSVKAATAAVDKDTKTETKSTRTKEEQPPPIPADPKLSKGAGLFEKLAASSNFVSEQIAEFGGTVSNIQGNLMGVGKVFDTIQRAALNFAGDLFKAALATTFFVNAFNPALVQQFTYNLKDLQAVIGTALVPVLNAFALETRLLADTLLPVLQALQPAFQQLGNALIGFLTPIILQIGNSLSTLAGTLNNLVGPAVRNFASNLGSFLAEMIRSLTPFINTLAKVFSAFLTVLSAALTVLKEFAPVIASVMTGFITLIGVNAVFALSTFIASVWAASNMLTLGLAGLVGAIVGFISWLTTKESEAAQGLTGVSEGLQARRAEYSTPEELSRNLIKAAFAGPNTDRLKNIDANGKRQVELLEIIANKQNPVAAGPANLRNEAGLKPGFMDMAQRVLQFGPNPQALGL